MYIDSEQKGKIVGIAFYVLTMLPLMFVLVTFVSNLFAIFVTSMAVGGFTYSLSMKIRRRVSRYYRKKYWSAPLDDRKH